MLQTCKSYHSLRGLSSVLAEAYIVIMGYFEFEIRTSEIFHSTMTKVVCIQSIIFSNSFYSRYLHNMSVNNEYLSKNVQKYQSPQEFKSLPALYSFFFSSNDRIYWERVEFSWILTTTARNFCFKIATNASSGRRALNTDLWLWIKYLITSNVRYLNMSEEHVASLLNTRETYIT